MNTPARQTRPSSPDAPARDDPLYVRSIEKAFRVLAAFGTGHASLSLSQIAAQSELDKSAAQRFTHTLERLGYLAKDPHTRRFALTPRAMEPGTHYLRSSTLLDRAMPWLLELSRTTEESVSLSVLDGVDIVYLARLTSRHMISSTVLVGARLPAYCTAPGVAMLARLPEAEARGVLERSDLRAHTSHTVWQMTPLLDRLRRTASQGYAMTVEEIFPSDVSLAATIVGSRNETLGAVSLSVSRLRLAPDEAEARFAPLLIATAHAMSAQGLPP